MRRIEGVKPMWEMFIYGVTAGILIAAFLITAYKMICEAVERHTIREQKRRINMINKRMTNLKNITALIYGKE